MTFSFCESLRSRNQYATFCNVFAIDSIIGFNPCPISIPAPSAADFNFRNDPDKPESIMSAILCASPSESSKSAVKFRISSPLFAIIVATFAPLFPNKSNAVANGSTALFI